MAGTSGTYREFSMAGRCADCWEWWDMRLVGNRNQTTEGLLRGWEVWCSRAVGSHRRDLITQQVWTSTHKFKHTKNLTSFVQLNLILILSSPILTLITIILRRGGSLKRVPNMIAFLRVYIVSRNLGKSIGLQAACPLLDQSRGCWSV